MTDTGLLMVHTGNGKGKTTAALGMAFRALGHGLPVCVIQFIKGSLVTGEALAAGRFADLLEFHVSGAGVSWESHDPQVDRAAAQAGWKLAQARIASGTYHLVILDEFTYTLKFGYIDEAQAVDFLQRRPTAVHVLITGRDASRRLQEAADLVTEMRSRKHPFQAGIPAQRGIEF